jgi:hypothetical protein
MSKKWRVHPTVQIASNEKPNKKIIELSIETLPSLNDLYSIIGKYTPTHYNDMIHISNTEGSSHILCPYHNGRFSQEYAILVDGSVSTLESTYSYVWNKYKDIQNDEIYKTISYSQDNLINKYSDKKIERNNIKSIEAMYDIIRTVDPPNTTDILMSIKQNDPQSTEFYEEHMIHYLRRFRRYNELVIDLKKLQTDCKGDIFTYFMDSNNYFQLQYTDEKYRLEKFLIDNEYIEEYEEEGCV